MAGRYRLLWFFVFLFAIVLLATVIVVVVEQFFRPLSFMERSFAPLAFVMLLVFYGLALLTLGRLGLRLEFGNNSIRKD